MTKLIEFLSDRITIKERESDNSYKVQFNTGEYMQAQIVKLMALPKDVSLKVTVEVEE